MKQGIHPQWHDDAVVSCACGNTFTVGASKKEIRIDICAKCHPFFTGEMKFVDSMGRVEKFQQKQKAAQVTKEVVQAKKKKKEEDQARRANAPKSLKEMLMGMK
jgi:large subunit ribosomal protein L31